jgi:Ca2+-transporting ATPase
VLGETRDATDLIAYACLSVVITHVEEWRSEKMLKALRDVNSLRALVVRNGKRQRIAGRDGMMRDQRTKLT